MEQENQITLTFNVSTERMKGLKWGIARRVQSNPAAMHAYLARFMWHEEDDRYMTAEEADAVLDELTLEEIGEAFEQVEQLQGEAAVPPQ